VTNGMWPNLNHATLDSRKGSDDMLSV